MQALRSHDRECDVMLDPSGHFSRGEVLVCRLEEVDRVGHFGRGKVLAYDLEEFPSGIILERRA